MSNIASEVISRFSNLQPQVWQNVSVAMSEAAGLQVNLEDALTVATEVSDLYSEMSSPKLIVQFAFANMPDNFQVVLIGTETLRDMYEAFTGKTKDSVDESVLTDLRPSIEAIVQGMCLAAGNLKGEAMVASGLVTRLQIFSFPQNMQHVEQLVRTNVRLSAQDLNGSVTWLVDEPTARMLMGMEMSSEDLEEAAAIAANELNFGSADGPSRKSGASPQIIGIEDTGLDILLDIPLEVTVELGRVKMVVRDVVELGSGSIVEIDKAAGEPVDVMVNGRLVARGEVVVIEDNFGVRITEILSQADRLAKLNEVA